MSTFLCSYKRPQAMLQASTTGDVAGKTQAMLQARPQAMLQARPQAMLQARPQAMLQARPQGDVAGKTTAMLQARPQACCRQTTGDVAGKTTGDVAGKTHRRCCRQDHTGDVAGRPQAMLQARQQRCLQARPRRCCRQELCRQRPRRIGRPRGPERVSLSTRILVELDRAMDSAVEASGLSPQPIVEEALREWFVAHGYMGRRNDS